MVVQVIIVWTDIEHCFFHVRVAARAPRVGTKIDLDFILLISSLRRPPLHRSSITHHITAIIT
jgi:hypothetical protein